ncbi:kinase [Fragilaria crotonensis]|nr:kinase [Fragilaria crotonensis]
MSSCETSLVVPPEETAVTSLLPTDSLSNSSRSTLKQKVIKALRMFARVVKLAVALTPLLLLYPLLHRKPPQKDAHELALSSAEAEKLSWFSQFYLNRCVRNVEWSGAAVVKLMQWLSSRPDLVGHEFCSIFQRLQDDTTPHAWKYTEQALQDAYGNDWRDKIRIDKLIGSGCIGQVYKGYVKLPSSVEEVPVAIKVLHPSIDQDMETDLNLMRFAADVIPRIWEPLSWLNPQGAVEEFGRMLMLQLDLRYEARNLQRFNRDFERDADKVIFPKLVPEFHATHNVLVETFIEGLPILEFAKRNADDHTLLRKLCVNGITAVCKMIFIQNHCHGDLHPGNVLVTNDHRLALLDVGIVNEYTDMDHQLIVDILTSFIRYDGRTAGRLMVDNSKARVGSALEEELFVDKMDALSQLARGSNYLMEHLGSYISQICEAAATHHVLMNQSFVSAALAIKVQEGIVLSLDPNMEIWKVANPIILEGAAIRKARKLLSLGNSEEPSAFRRWIGKFQSEKNRSTS